MKWAPEPFTSYDEYKHSLGEPGEMDLRNWRAMNEPDKSVGHEEFIDAAPSSDDAKAALRVILSAGKRSRFRALTVACHRNHTIAEVYRAPAPVGLILAGKGPLTRSVASVAGGEIPGHYDPEYGYVETVEWDYTWEQLRRTNREEPVVCLVEQLKQQDAKVQCRCTTAVFDYDDIAGYLATGKRRVVYAKEVQRS